MIEARVIRQLPSLLGLVALLAGCSSTRDMGYEGEPGHAPRGFTTGLTGGGGPVSWVIREDATAPSGRGRVLVQESADQTSYRFPTCVYDGLVARDVAVEVSFKPISGELD